jgi:ParB family chromosome partitioning protein
MLSRLWNIPKPNQNVLRSWKLEAKYEDENPGVNDDVVAGALEAVWEEQQTIAHRAKHRAWTDEMKQSAGVVVSWTGQEVKVQRGVVLCADEKMEEKDASTDQALKKSIRWTPSVSRC